MYYEFLTIFHNICFLNELDGYLLNSRCV